MVPWLKLLPTNPMVLSLQKPNTATVASRVCGGGSVSPTNSTTAMFVTHSNRAYMQTMPEYHNWPSVNTKRRYKTMGKSREVFVQKEILRSYICAPSIQTSTHACLLPQFCKVRKSPCLTGKHRRAVGARACCLAVLLIAWSSELGSFAYDLHCVLHLSTHCSRNFCS